MSKIKFAEIVKSIKLATLKHSPAILTGIGIAGMISATAMAVKATPKALMLIEAQKKAEKTEKLTIVDSAKVAWVCYIPAAITIILSSACLIGANSVNTRRNAALAAAYTLSESALKEYQGKVVETIGEKKEQIVREAVAKDKLKTTIKLKAKFATVQILIANPLICSGRISETIIQPTGPKLIANAVM